MNNWETMKMKRRPGQVYNPAYRRVDKANRCMQDTAFGRDQYCNCPSCREAYRQRLFWRKQNPDGFIPLHLVTLLDHEPKRYQIPHAIQHPRKVKDK